jgi:arylsulfatase A-like enzyme
MVYKRKSRAVTRREFVTGALAGAAVAAASGSSSAKVTQQKRPNVLFILADDLGWGDLSCYGRPDYRTPNLDRLAQEGVRFTNAYSAAPVCTPTRCAFITGRYPARATVGLEEPITERKLLGERVKTVGLPPEHPTIGALMKGGGYDTALVGKWHLGYLPEYGPNRHGFDEFFGILSGAGDFFTHKDPGGAPDLFEDLVPVERVGYMTDLLTERAVQYIRRPRRRPFYLSLHYTAPHWPWEGPNDEQVSRRLKPGYDGFTAGGTLKVYASMMENLDQGVGRVMKALKEARLERETLVIFTSDNGGERFSYNWPFTGKKFDLREGGIRVPAIVRWPGVVPANRTMRQVAVTMDWTATILAAAQTKADPNYPLDGDDLLPVIRGTRAPYERALFWRTRKQDAALLGNWKYLREGEAAYLFDLSADEREQADFKGENPQMFERARAEFQKWQSQVLPYPKPADDRKA